MTDKKRVCFIGNRHQVLEEILSNDCFEIADVLVPEGSPVCAQLPSYGLDAIVFAEGDHADILERIGNADFDVLVSNGCPVLLPVTQMRRESQLFLNVHPSLLPKHRGRHPANAALLANDAEAGATLHHMDDGADTGNIIHQCSFAISPDLDLGHLYAQLFEFEARVFREGVERFAASGWDFPGDVQGVTLPAYTRKAEDMRVDLESMSSEEVLLRIRAFGHVSQGCRLSVGGRTFVVYSAEAVDTSAEADSFSSMENGAAVFEADGSMLLKVEGALVKVTSFEER